MSQVGRLAGRLVVPDFVAKGDGSLVWGDCCCDCFGCCFRQTSRVGRLVVAAVVTNSNDSLE